MKFGFAFLFSLIIISPTGFCQKIQTTRNYSAEAQLLKKTIQASHFRPRSVDDKFSEWVYFAFINRLDPDRLFFTEEDFNSIITYKYKIDDDLNLNRWLFLPAMSMVYEKALKRADKITSELLQGTFAFNGSDSYKPDTTWAKDDRQLRDRWANHLKAETLSRLIEINRTSVKTDPSKFLSVYEPEARQRVKAATRKIIHRALNHAEGYQNFMGAEFLETIAASFDPHSSYLPPTRIENLMGALSGEGYYFGFSFKENVKGDIEVDALAPGGPAWRSGALNSGDVVKKVKWDGQQPVDLHGAEGADLDEILSESNHSALEITIEKPTGELQTITLRKEKMAPQESVVKSFILQGKEKIGYINLPGFYSSWGQAEGAACANDVASEIIKLKAEGINGLILDVRFNGGGSMLEAVSMAGIFIDAGPVGVIQQKSLDFITLKDFNRGTIYDGPLVVLVNKMSASASEILAAALQDHNRAIIVGSETYGKATAQDLFPLEKSLTTDVLKNAKAGIGYAKITIQKIFRITGKTTQLIGVQPDVVLPDLYDSLSIGEVSMPLALPSDSIIKKIYYQPAPRFPLTLLRTNSETRVRDNTNFQRIMRASSLIRRFQGDEREVSLNWTLYQQQHAELQKLVSEFQATRSNTASFSVDHHGFDKQHMKLDAYVEEFNSWWVKKLRQDVSLEEAFHIICDYIDVSKKK